MAEIGPLARHELVRVDPASWAHMLAERPDLHGEPLLVEWADRGWPVIARRPACADLSDGNLPFGLPLPPAQGKQRVMLRLPRTALIDLGPPPLLETARTSAPEAWQPTIDALLEVDGVTRCFGSMAWQYLTGLSYLTGGSDLDLLWRVSSGDHTTLLAEALVGIDLRAPMRIDGEFVAASGRAVQWREWLSPEPELVVKSHDGVALLARSEILS